MKKLFGLLAVCALVACNESSDPASAADSWANANGNNNAAANNGNSAADSLQKIIDQMRADSLQNVINQMQQQSQQPASSDAMVGMSSMGTIGGLSSTGVAPVVSSSSVAVAPVSSSAVVVPKSSAAVTPKSSAAVVDDGTIKLELWDASLGDPHVPVGNQKGGWWYSYDDSNNGGSSEIVWDAEPGAGGDMTPVIEACGGICGSYTLIVGTNEWQPFVGFAFGFGADNTYAGDASALLGVCVEYTSTADIHLELGLTAAKEKAIDGGANAFYLLPASSAKKVVDIGWAQFAPPDWAKTVVAGAASAKILSSLKFKIQGDENGEDGAPGSFAIYKVGPKGSCN